MNDKYFDMVKTMAQQLDTSDLMELVVNLVSHLNSVHHFDDDGTIQELLTEICNKHGMYTSLGLTTMDIEGFTIFKHTTHQGHRTYGELDEMARVLQESHYLVISPDKLKELSSTQRRTQ